MTEPVDMIKTVDLHKSFDTKDGKLHVLKGVSEHIVKGENIPSPEIPESFKVLIKEMKSLALDVELVSDSKARVDRDIETVEDLPINQIEEEVGGEDDMLDIIANELMDMDTDDDSLLGVEEGE